jgi:predicted ATPase
MIGEPGIGKTRLLDEVVARSPDFRVLRTRGEEYESATPYFAMRAVMRSALDLDPAADTSEVVARLGLVVESVEPSLVPWIPLLGVLLGLDLPPTPETAALDERFLRERLAEVAWTFLHRVLRPTFLAIDDSHHLDESTRDLVLRLFRAGAGHRAMVVLTHQASDRLVDTDELEAERCLLVRLEPLSQEASLELVEIATEDQPLRPDEADIIVERSGGNPMFLMELIDAVRASGSVESLPDSVEALIAGQIDRLAPADRMILRYAAVLGTRFDPALLEEAVRSDVELDVDVWARLADILTPDPDGSLRFENRLVRDAAYEGLPYPDGGCSTSESGRRSRPLPASQSRRRSRRSPSTSTRHSAGTSPGPTVVRPVTAPSASTRTWTPRRSMRRPSWPADDCAERTPASSPRCTSGAAMPCSCSAITTRPIEH